jgi:hypothetical protein
LYSLARLTSSAVGVDNETRTGTPSLITLVMISEETRPLPIFLHPVIWSHHQHKRFLSLEWCRIIYCPFITHAFLFFDSDGFIQTPHTIALDIESNIFKPI